MRKKIAAAGRLSVLIMALVPFALFWRDGLCACAREQVSERVVETFLLLPEETVQVPRYLVEKGTAYELDEASIVVEETERGGAEGADVVTFSRKVEDLSDNDLSKIEKSAVLEGTNCELLSAAYQVEETNENGIPIRYSAVCEYGGLKKYSESYPTAWQLTARYNRCEGLTEPEIVEIQENMQNVWEETGYGAARTKRVTGETEGAENEGESGKKPVPRPRIKRILIEPKPEEEDKRKITKLILFLAAAAAGTGVTVPFIVWFSVLTAPLFGLRGEGKYRYIGRIRLKREDGFYTAYLTGRLRARAELPVFRIKLPGKVRKKARAGMLRVHCPDGRIIMVTVGRAVRFTVEGD